MKKFTLVLLPIIFSLILISCVKENHPQTGNVVFIHPDGTGLSDWNIARILHYGPDSELNWDKMSNMAIYKSHMKNSVTAASHSGATVHSYGVKVIKDSYGMDGKAPVTSASGKQKSIMHEAMEAGIKTALINSGSIIEPGTSVFVASVPSRQMGEEIAKQVIESGVDILLSGGEELFLPKGTKGVHCESGVRTDSLNLIEQAINAGYKVVYTKDQFLALPNNTEKVLGLFAYNHTFNDEREEVLKEKNLPLYKDNTPTLAEMTSKTLEILNASGKQFFMVVEEEATDNFANYNNARGVLEALKRSDDAIGVVREFIKSNKTTMLITAADSEAGGMEIEGVEIDNFDYESTTPLTDKFGAPVDGIDGNESKYFISAPDQYGNKLPFKISWALGGDAYGSVIAKADGFNSSRMNGLIDNTYIYRIMYYSLFGKEIK